MAWSASRLIRLIGLAVVVVSVLLGASLGGDWVRALVPWGVRWWAGELAVVAALVVLPVLALRRGWVGPWATIDPARSAGRAAHRGVALGLQFVTGATAVIPLFRREYRAKMDWDFLYQHYEALRQSVLVYGQVPWWNPWNVGGFPLMGEPQVGLVSPAAVLVIVAGTEWGVWLTTILSLMLGVEGARRLARLWLEGPAAVATAAAVYGWNGLIVLFTGSCPALTWCYWQLPWFLWCAFRLPLGRRPAIELGGLLAVAGLGLIQYPVAYALMVTGVLLIAGLMTSPEPGRASYLARVGLAAGVCLALAGWRLAIVGGVMRDYPRKAWSQVDFAPLDFLDAMVARTRPGPWWEIPGPTAEWAAYLGIVPLTLAAVSLRRGWRWWHTLAAVTLALALGSSQWYHLSYWVKDWPVFSTMHLVGRWRIVAALGIGLAAADEIQELGRRAGPRGRWLALGFSAFIVGDLGLYLFQVLPRTFDLPAREIRTPEPPLPRGPVVNLPERIFHHFSQDFGACRRGYGVIRGYEPLLDYDRGRSTARRWLGHPDYLGESWSEGRAVSPTLWTPNRIEFRLDPGREVELNINPGSWWVVNGDRPFAELRCVEVRERFLARADDSGLLRVEARPPHLGRSVVASLIGLAVIAATFRLARTWP